MEKINSIKIYFTRKNEINRQISPGAVLQNGHYLVVSIILYINIVIYGKNKFHKKSILQGKNEINRQITPGGGVINQYPKYPGEIRPHTPNKKGFYLKVKISYLQKRRSHFHPNTT